VSCEPVKRNPPICFNCSLQSQAREAGQPIVVEPVFRTKFCLVNCYCFGEQFALFRLRMNLADNISPGRSAFARQTDCRRMHYGRKTIAASSDLGPKNTDFESLGGARLFQARKKVRGALFDDGHGMRKRKDSPPGMLPSRDSKYTRRTAHGTRFRRQQGKQKTMRAQKRSGRGNRSCCTICRPSGHEFVGALVCSSRLSRPSARGYPLVV
jgi:hypothetical protein